MDDESKQTNEHWSQRWLRTGSFQAWFGWIESLTLTSVFVSASLKVDQLLLKCVLGVIAAISVWHAFHWGIAGASNFLTESLAFQRIPRRARAVLGWVIGATASTLVVLALIPVFLNVLN